MSLDITDISIRSRQPMNLRRVLIVTAVTLMLGTLSLLAIKQANASKTVNLVAQRIEQPPPLPPEEERGKGPPPPGGQAPFAGANINSNGVVTREEIKAYRNRSRGRDPRRAPATPPPSPPDAGGKMLPPRY